MAIKMILSGQLADAADIRRFYTEAEAAANLDHPGIVPVFEVGQHEDQHYFSMAYIEGPSLAQKVANGPLPPSDVAVVVHKICDAMSYAHQRGVIHRDLKPANILLCRDGQPKVTDFGLAKRMEGDSNLTGTGQILGTPSYMAPEQARGQTEEVGALADVYALGAIMYCLLTGRPPFQASNPMDTLLQVMEKEPVSPRVLNNQVPKDLETICLRSLEKEPTARYPSSIAMAQDLARFLNDEPILARAISRPARAWRWCRRKPVLAGMVVSIVLLLFPKVEAYSQAAIAKLENHIRDMQQLGNPDETSVLCAANGAVALIRLGRGDLTWPLLRDSHDQRLRSYIVDRVASCGVPVNRVIDGLSRAEDAAIRQALFLGVIAYPLSSFTTVQREVLVDCAKKAFHDDPDSGVHAACDLLLRKLDAADEMPSDGHPLPQRQSSADWFVNSQNQTFAVVTGKEFTMGSPEHEVGRRSDESQHRRIIPRRFAISCKEVTVDEFHRFLADRKEIAHTYSKQQSPQADCPQTSVTWYEAAAYCNWLSERDGIAQHEWAFVANADGKYASGMSIPGDYLSRAGYRLPTEAEWEFACRSGSSNIRCYGNAEALLGKYAWYLSNALDRSWPVGAKLPNRLGLCDMHGNVWEWCSNGPSPYPSSDFPAYDQLAGAETIEDGQPRVLRGGSYFYHSIYTRAALRNKEPVDARYYGIGVRPARTMR